LAEALDHGVDDRVVVEGDRERAAGAVRAGVAERAGVGRAGNAEPRQ
jgi:hypothetical protein